MQLKLYIVVGEIIITVQNNWKSDSVINKQYVFCMCVCVCGVSDQLEILFRCTVIAKKAKANTYILLL